MRFLLIFLALALATSRSHAQGENVFRPYVPSVPAAAADTPGTVSPGDVVIHADPKVEELMRKYSSHKHSIRGYRVQIFLGDHKHAEEAKRAFLQKNPDLPIYQSWFAPNFRLRVGDLRTRLEAERLLRDLRVAYPGSYIVPDEIEMPALAE
ncbi:MAG: SPOR domain-containing protein [Flavobacteriales bacterium]|nr:SPOR domain-containing protein [Flavobacteriales bacterium]